MRVLIERIYKQGMTAGRDWFKRGLETGTWKHTPNPYLIGSKHAEEWRKGYEDGCYDAESCYYV